MTQFDLLYVYVIAISKANIAMEKTAGNFSFDEKKGEKVKDKNLNFENNYLSHVQREMISPTIPEILKLQDT